MKTASTHQLVGLWAGGGHVVAGLLEPVYDHLDDKPFGRQTFGRQT